MYPVDVGRLLSYNTQNPLYIQCGDSMYNGSYPVMVKCKKANSTSASVLANLNSVRHFRPIQLELQNDVAWSEKISTVMWRGADTGGVRRLDFVRKFYKNYNVGFSKYVQDSLVSGEYSNEYLAGEIPIRNMLRYKYLPVVPGNDKASSLGWIMASNSVPIMPRPEIHSWMCEPWMIPGVHFVEVKPDFSDMEEKLDWCRDNDRECKRIADNGKKFMMQFENSTVEKYIENELVNIIGIYGRTRGFGYITGQGLLEEKKAV